MEVRTCRHSENSPSTAYKKGCRCPRCKAQKALEKQRSRARGYQSKAYQKGLLHRINRVRFDNGYVVWRGYQGHPLAQSGPMGLILAHRWVMYEMCNGLAPQACWHCEAPLGDWSKVAVDHIDHDKTNFAPSNLAALCVPCNSSKQPSLAHRYKALTPAEQRAFLDAIGAVAAM